MVTGWILQDNLEPFLTTLGWIVGSSLDDDDWQAITTDLLDGGGGEYAFDGGQKTTFSVAIGLDTSILNMKVDAPVELEPQMELAIAIFQHFHLRRSRG